MKESEILILTLAVLCIILIICFLVLMNKSDKIQSKLNKFADSVPVGIVKFRLDNIFTVIDYNKEFLNIIGYSSDLFKEDVCSQLSKLIFVVDYEEFCINIIEQLNFSSYVKSDFRLVKRDGSFIWVTIYGELLKSSEGYDYINATILDITYTKYDNTELEVGIIEDYIYDSIASGVIQLSVDYNPLILDLNKVAIIMLGYTKQDIKNKFEDKILKMIHKEDRATLYSCIQKVNALGEDSTESVRLRVVKRDGSLIWLNVVCKLNIDYSGQRDVIMSFVDITDYKNQETALKDRNNFLEQFVNNISLAIIIFEKRTTYKIHYINDVALKYLGYQELKDHESLFLKSIVYNRDFAAFNATIEKAYKDKVEGYMQFRYIDKLGYIRWASSTIRRHSDVNGKPHMALSFLDITETKEYQEDVHKSNSNYKSVVENANLCSFEWDIRVDVLKSNKIAMKLFGFEEMETGAVETFSKSSIIMEDDFKALFECIEQIKQGSYKASCPLRIKHQESYIKYNVLFTCFVDKKNVPKNAIIVLVPFESKIENVNFKSDVLYDEEDLLMSCEVNFTTGSFIRGKKSLSKFLNTNISFNYAKYIDHIVSCGLIHKDYIEDFGSIFCKENLHICFNNNKHFIKFKCKVLDYAINDYLDVEYVTRICKSDGHHLILKIHIKK